MILPSTPVHVVDIGANPIDGTPPYKSMLNAGQCRVTGFEPQQDALDRLHKLAGPHEHYLPYAIGDGQEHTLHITEQCSGMTSLLRPNAATHGIFDSFKQWGNVTKSIPVQTYRLDDLDELAPVDFLKIDVQGFELQIFKNAEEKLASCVAVHTEVAFVPLYENMPVIGDIDTYLRSKGYIPHCFASVKQWIISPTLINNNPRIGLNQLLEADMVYVKDFRYMQTFTSEQLRKLALIAHTCYNSWDLAARCIIELQNRNEIPNNTLQEYYNNTSRKREEPPAHEREEPPAHEREREREREREEPPAHERGAIGSRERSQRLTREKIWLKKWGIRQKMTSSSQQKWICSLQKKEITCTCTNVFW